MRGAERNECNYNYRPKRSNVLECEPQILPKKKVILKGKESNTYIHPFINLLDLRNILEWKTGWAEKPIASGDNNGFDIIE